MGRRRRTSIIRENPEQTYQCPHLVREQQLTPRLELRLCGIASSKEIVRAGAGDHKHCNPEHHLLVRTHPCLRHAGLHGTHDRQGSPPWEVALIYASS